MVTLNLTDDLLYRFSFDSTVLTYSYSTSGSRWNGIFNGIAEPNRFTTKSAFSDNEKLYADVAVNTWSTYTLFNVSKSTSALGADIYLYKANTVAGTNTTASSGVVGYFQNEPTAQTAAAFPPDGAEYTRAEIAINQNLGVDSLFGYWTTVHELGHALGLQHEDTLHGSAYNSDMTIMSYNVPGSGYNATTGEWETVANGRFPISPMPYDVASIEKAYGAAGLVNNGSTTYRYIEGATNVAPGYFVGTPRAWTAVDTGGTDTFDLSALPTVLGGVTIDLREAIGPDDAGGNAEWLDHKTIVGQEYVYIARGTVIERAIGTSKVDTITGNASANYLEGGAGDDIIKGGGGADALVGGLDEDRLYGEDGDDLLLDFYRTDTSADSLWGGANNDRLFGGKNDRLFGESGSDTYWLNASDADDGYSSGSNTFIAYTGNYAPDNIITLHSGGVAKIPNTVVDKIYINEGAAAEIFGAGANDQLYWGNTLISGIFYKQPAGGYQYKLGENLYASGLGTIYDGKGNEIARLHLTDSDSGDDILGTAAGITLSLIDGAPGTVGAYSALPFTPDFLAAYPDPTLVTTGTAAANTLVGGYLANTLIGLGGNDTLDGLTGEDVLQPGTGSNSMTGGADRDTFVLAVDSSGPVTDTITDFDAGAGEKIDLSAFGTGLALSITQTGSTASFTVASRTVANDNQPRFYMKIAA